MGQQHVAKLGCMAGPLATADQVGLREEFKAAESENRTRSENGYQKEMSLKINRGLYLSFNGCSRVHRLKIIEADTREPNGPSDATSKNRT